MTTHTEDPGPLETKTVDPSYASTSATGGTETEKQDGDQGDQQGDQEQSGDQQGDQGGEQQPGDTASEGARAHATGEGNSFLR